MIRESDLGNLKFESKYITIKAAGQKLETPNHGT